MEDLSYWIWLSRIENVSKKVLFDLLERYKLPEKIWSLNKDELIQLGLSKKIAENITNQEYKKNLDRYIQYMRNNSIEIVTIYNKYYPESLKNIYDPPISIYIKGNKEILNNLGVAIIGCRNASEYGENIAKKFAYNLSKFNINIISGGARGIDTYSHIGSLQAKGNTIVILGSGVDIAYPPENKYLFEEITRNGGAIISEYALGTKPLPQNFPQRNRIISGISKGIIVVEAKKKSGTLITVEFALEQGKEVYVIPGNIDSSNSYGTNELIKQGAKMATSIEDILEDLI